MQNRQVKIGAVLGSQSPHAIARRPLGRQSDATRAGRGPSDAAPIR